MARLVRETPKRSARSRSVSCRIKRMQGVIKSATTGSTSELLRCRGIAYRVRPGPPGPPLKPRLEICTERLDPSPSRLRLIVVYFEQPPAASSTHAADACSAGPSGVGLGRRVGTVASPRARLGRPEERHAERACAADASTLPPSTRGKVKHCSDTVRDGVLEIGVWAAPASISNLA